MTKKKFRIIRFCIHTFFLLLGAAFFLVAGLLYENNYELGVVFIVLGFISLAVMGLLNFYFNKRWKALFFTGGSHSEINKIKRQNMIYLESHSKDNNLCRVIYSIYIKEDPTFVRLLSSPRIIDIEFSYNKINKHYAMSILFKNSELPTFFALSNGRKKSQKLSYDNKFIDVSNLGVNEIKALIKQGIEEALNPEYKKIRLEQERLKKEQEDIVSKEENNVDE